MHVSFDSFDGVSNDESSYLFDDPCLDHMIHTTESSDVPVFFTSIILDIGV